VIAQAKAACDVAPRGCVSFSSDAVLGGFYDASYAYRFGPPKHEVVAATLVDSNGQVLSEAFWFPQAQEPRSESATGIVAIAQAVADGYELTLASERFLYAVHLDVKGFAPGDNYFHLMPGRNKTVRLTSTLATPAPLRGYVDAMNLADAVRIELKI
jgi:beta-mannosidase